MSDLFNIPECPSPRLQWMREKGVKTHHAAHMDIEDEPWTAYVGDLEECINEGGPMENGGTEDEAIVNLAKANSWRLWNEKEAGK